ncbi:MAG: hypothetical protein P9L88_05485 [Candidatus Tantalella remota]|nr:hypothetical protein [Candidatus Tantalella remota]
MEAKGGGGIRFPQFSGSNYKVYITLFFAIIAAIISTRLITNMPDITKAGIIIAAVAFIVATFIDTNIGLIAILLSMLLSPEMEAGSTAGRSIVIRAEDLLLIIVSLTWLAKMAVRKTPLIRSSPLNAPIGIYVAVIIISTVRAMIAGNVLPLKGAFYVLKVVEYYILYFIVLNETSSNKQVKMFLVVLLLTAFFVGLYGNTHIGSVSRISAPFEGEGEPNTLGGYLLFILCLIGGLIFYYKEKRHLLILLLLFLVPTFLFTLSRASYLGMAVSMVAFVAITKDRRVFTAVLLLSLLGILVFSFGPQPLKDRVLGAFKPEESQELKQFGMVSLGPSPAARIRSWDAVFKEDISKAPILGRGVTGLRFLDSQYVLVLGETGFIGLFVFLWVMWRAWRAAYDTYNKVENPLYKGLTLGYLMGFAGLMAHAIGSNTFLIIRIAEPFWFFTAIVIKLVDIETGAETMKEYLAAVGPGTWRYR